MLASERTTRDLGIIEWRYSSSDEALLVAGTDELGVESARFRIEPGASEDERIVHAEDGSTAVAMT